MWPFLWTPGLRTLAQSPPTSSGKRRALRKSGLDLVASGVGYATKVPNVYREIGVSGQTAASGPLVCRRDCCSTIIAVWRIQTLRR